MVEGSKVEGSVVPEPSYSLYYPFYIAIYLTSLIFSNGKKGAIVDALYGIRWGHHLAEFDSPTNHPTVKMAFEGAQRICA